VPLRYYRKQSFSDMGKRRYAREAQSIYANLQAIGETLNRAEKHDATTKRIAEGLQMFVHEMDATEVQDFTSRLEKLAFWMRGE
jgi:hypothetical protein